MNKILKPKYKKGDKFEIEIAEVNIHYKDNKPYSVYRVKGFDSLMMTDAGLDRLKQLEQKQEKPKYTPLTIRKEFERYLVDKYENDYIGHCYLFKFDNGLGANVIKNMYSRGNILDLFELAVIKHSTECYLKPITNDVLGDLTQDEVYNYLQKIKDYKDVKVGDEVDVKYYINGNWRSKDCGVKFLLYEILEEKSADDMKYLIEIRNEKTNELKSYSTVVDVRKHKEEEVDDE